MTYCHRGVARLGVSSGRALSACQRSGRGEEWGGFRLGDFFRFENKSQDFPPVVRSFQKKYHSNIRPAYASSLPQNESKTQVKWTRNGDLILAPSLISRNATPDPNYRSQKIRQKFALMASGSGFTPL